jgi:predicted RNase H-related nuclease YkuK (DUF458 family)
MFNSPTYGSLSLKEVRKKILDYMSSDPECSYRLVVGTDSQSANGQGADYVTAIVVLRRGRGGIYFWTREYRPEKQVLRQRMYEEAVKSLSMADMVVATMHKDGITKYDVEIHVDIGKHGDTRNMISEIVGMIRGSGWKVRIKPDSFAASSVADRHA